ncbi:hypothetical protein [Streptomyces sp. LBL]|uniref:hypothetical protein n=1 Tax=Streptomyces sp. LBL TaxID=2940562 RepID=UPI002475D01F|nr:hypothetical protein [Streptomyces sp. LBL]
MHSRGLRKLCHGTGHRGNVRAVGFGFGVSGYGHDFRCGVQLTRHGEVHAGRVQLPPSATLDVQPHPRFNEHGSLARRVRVRPLVRERAARGGHDALRVDLFAGLQLG